MVCHRLILFLLFRFLFLVLLYLSSCIGWIKSGRASIGLRHPLQRPTSRSLNYKLKLSKPDTQGRIQQTWNCAYHVDSSATVTTLRSTYPDGKSLMIFGSLQISSRKSLGQFGPSPNAVELPQHRFSWLSSPGQLRKSLSDILVTL